MIENDTEKMEDVDLSLREELIGLHAGINPFISSISSSRSVMVSGHVSQMVTIEDGDTKIIQTGIETQLGKNTFSKKFNNDVMIISVIKRYNGLGINYVKADVGFTIIYEDLATNEVDFLEVPNYFKLHQYFGFKFKNNQDVIDTLTPGTVIPADTIVADAPNVGKNSTLKYGVNANVAYMSIPETTEDGMVISKSLAEKLSYRIFETRTVEFGEDSFPLNLYGDENEYKAFPDIGETVNEDSVLIAIRDYDEMLTPTLTSINDVRQFNPIFDKCYYVKSTTSKVIDIKIIHQPKFKKDIYTGTDAGLIRYVNSTNKYYGEIIDLYEALEREHYRKYKNNDLKISERFQRLVLDSYVMLNKSNKKIKFMHKKANIDIYRIEFIVETRVTPKIGSKITLLTGSKGVIVDVWDDEKMPYNPHTGERAHVIVDDGSIIARTNVANVYEQYFNGASRTVQRYVKQELHKMNKDVDTLTDDEVVNMFNIPLGLLEIIGTEQYEGYLNTAVNEKRIILREIVNEEFYIYYKISSKRKPYEIVHDIGKSIYKPAIGSVTWISNGEAHTSEKDIMLAPQYVILLGKTSDNFLSCASPHLNHFGMPTSVNSTHRDLTPWKNSANKILSETETRLYLAYGKSDALLAEIKDRGISIPTHKHIYEQYLTLDKPTDVNRLVDRKEVPYGNDVSVELVNNIINAAGMSMGFVPDDRIIHEEQPKKKE